MEKKVDTNETFRSGFISIIGRPNVGKSTLLNAIVGEKIAAVSHKPNTTRNRIAGVRTLPEAQLIFLDTPGIHKASTELNKTMVRAAVNAIGDADVVLMMIDVKNPFGKGDRFVIENLPKPALLVINKIDAVEKEKILKIMDESQEFQDKFLEVLPISAINAEGVDILVEIIVDYLPEGPMYFPEYMITDQPERFIAAEFIREKIFKFTHQEIPYKVAVVVDEFKDDQEKELVSISATVYVERSNHKGIIIGKNGQMLKQIGTYARQDIERLLRTKVYLELWVKVREKWTKRGNLIREFGYGT